MAGSFVRESIDHDDARRAGGSVGSVGPGGFGDKLLLV
ncbi:hypothetical protein BFJ71_g12672 [Fusarium oxysporum]|nr:hypothetical protein BFJ71_g12672 [Fusarium oxysporum]